MPHFPLSSEHLFHLGQTQRPGDPQEGGWPGQAPDGGTPCQDLPLRRALLLRYALSRCSEKEAQALEAHLLLCEACFEDLKTLDRAGVLLRELTGPGALTLEQVLELGTRSDGGPRDGSGAGDDAPAR